MRTNVLKAIVSAGVFSVFSLVSVVAVYAAEGEYESSQICKECHEDIYRNWRHSLHALSFSNPIFQTAYRKAYTETKGEAKKYCLNCHAPTVRMTGDYDAEMPITREGVTCDFCHTISGVVLQNHANPFVSEPGGAKRSVLKSAESPHHETSYSVDFASSKLCAGCHGFVNRHGVRVGDTYSEWKHSSFAGEGKQCQHCHMREIPGKTAREGGRDKIHDHSLSHTMSTMKGAITLKISETRKTQNRLGVQVVITNARAGHSVPTGTPERRLILEVSALDASGNVIDTQKKEYHSIFVDGNGAEISSDGDVFLYGVQKVFDNRLRPQESRNEKFLFSHRVDDISVIAADTYFLYRPVIAEKTEMRIPLYSADAAIK